MSNRRYIKRIWRVPKDRGALEYFATLVTKALVKHGWPVRWEPADEPDAFIIYEQGQSAGDLPADIQNACEIAVRIVARTYRVDVTHYFNVIAFNRSYQVTTAGHFKEVK